jgi:hypothetical protein
MKESSALSLMPAIEHNVLCKRQLKSTVALRASKEGRLHAFRWPREGGGAGPGISAQFATVMTRHTAVGALPPKWLSTSWRRSSLPRLA